MDAKKITEIIKDYRANIDKERARTLSALKEILDSSPEKEFSDNMLDLGNALKKAIEELSGPLMLGMHVELLECIAEVADEGGHEEKP